MAYSPERLRVGIFSNAYRPLISGVVNSIDLIRKGLREQGHVPFVYAPRVGGYRDTGAGVFRFPSLEFSSQVQYPVAIPFWPSMHRRISRSRLQVLHTHHPFLLGDYALYWSRRRGIPLVYTFHTQYEQYSHYLRMPQKPLKALARWAVGRFARRCDLIIAPSPSIRDLLQEYGIQTWTETLENAIELSPFRQATRCRRELGWPEDAVIGLYAGRLGKEKNLEFLVRALPERPDAYLAIVGDGPVLEELMELARELGVSGRVIFTGAIDYACMPRYFAAADFFTISSTTEVKPLVVLEALASGLPVVAVAACGTQDTLRHEHDGLLTELDLEQFRGAWTRLLDEPELRRGLSSQARRTAAGYSIDGYIERLVELYREARRRKRRSLIH